MFDASRLHVSYGAGAQPGGPVTPRRYTLTHSDRTGDLFLTIGAEYDQRALKSLQVRLERDEVLGEWIPVEGTSHLELHMMAQGGLPLFGTGAMRCAIFRHYRPMVLSAIRHGDRALVAAHPELDDAAVVAWFHWRGGRDESEPWGRLGEWR